MDSHLIMMKPVGRIVARGDNITGLFIPMQSGLDGVYQVFECMGELTIKRVGDPAMDRNRFVALDLEGLHNERASAAMTQDELDGVDDGTWRRLA